MIEPQFLIEFHDCCFWKLDEQNSFTRYGKSYIYKSPIATQEPKESLNLNTLSKPNTFKTLFYIIIILFKW